MASIDAQLVQRTMRGDEEAFCRLVERHQGLLLHFVFRRVGNLSDAEDIVQEAFLKAHQRLDQLREPEKFAGWLFQIARHQCASYQRHRQAGTNALEAWAELSGVEALVSSAHLVEGRELSDAIVKAVRTLPDDHRQVFTLYLEGVPYGDIADTVHLPTSTVSGRLQMAKQRIQRTLAAQGLLNASPGPLQAVRTYLGKELIQMTRQAYEPLRRRIYGTGSWYYLRWEGVSPNRKELSHANTVMYLFRRLISGRMYPDIFLENGGRLYQAGPEDDQIPQYSTPECDDWAQLVAQHKAGERLLHRIAKEATEQVHQDGFADEGRIALYNQSPDEPGALTDCRDNYLLATTVDAEQLSTCLVPFLVSQPIYTGAGKLKLDDGGASYWISARADTIGRMWPTQEEYQHKQHSKSHYPHDVMLRICHKSHMHDTPRTQDDRYHRLQIRMHDANLSEQAIYLRVGTTGLVLQMIEDGVVPTDYALGDPVKALQAVASDPSCKATIRLADGREWTAIELQREYLTLARRYFESRGIDPNVTDLLETWESTLDRLAEDPVQLDREVDWVIKRHLLETYQTEEGLEWSDPRLLERAAQYHNISPDHGLYYRLERDGQVDRLLTDAQIEVAMHSPPESTRAKFRGKFVKLANDRRITCGVNWSYIQIYEPYQKLFLSTDPLAAEYVEASRIAYSLRES